MTVSVLITCHNRVDTTLLCLNALRDSFVDCGSSDSKVVVFLVDDGSTDGTGRKVQGWFDAVSNENFRGNVISADSTLFWSRGMALAWRKSLEYEKINSCKFDFFLWLNDDVILEKTGLSSIFRDYEKVRSVVAGACGVKRNDEWVMTYGGMDASYRKLVPNGSPQRLDGWFTGNVLLVPRDAYEKVGLISDEYSHACGDNDYAMRLKRAEIPFYASSQFVGVCEYGPVNKVKEWPIYKRVPLLFMPGMWNLRDLWIFQCKFYNPFRALIYCLHRIYVVLKG